MTEFAVWAPVADRVDLVLEGDSLMMQEDGQGWWRRVADAEHGSRYGFSLDGSPARPDPRSHSQPDGVHGMSAIVDHGRFRWTDDKWRGVSHRGAIIYELHVGTFTDEGTLEAAIARLPHLVDLGIDAIELLPVAEFPGDRGWGYDVIGLYSPHHSYGGSEGLKRLVDACHAHGVGVVLDVVYNHLGPSGNHLSEFGPYFSDTHQTNWGPGINFDGPGSDEVRRFVIDNALMWMSDYHMDGLRIDAVHAIIDTSAIHVLEELAVEVDALATRQNRPLFLIAESDLNDPRFVRNRDAGGYGLDAAWADEWHHALHAALTGEQSGYYRDFGSLDDLGKSLRQAWVYDGTFSPHRQRHHGRSPAGLSGHQFVICTQNHDQVGNRAEGERSSALMGDARLRIAAALLLTSPFTPMIFQGEEWGASTPFQYFTDHHDAELGEAVSEGRREEFAQFGWDPDQIPDPQDPETFQRSKLDWDEIERSPHADLLDWYRRLIAVRAELEELADPRLDHIEVVVDDGSRTVAIRRGLVRILVNLGVEVARFDAGEDTTIHAASNPDVHLTQSEIAIPADAVVILRDSAHG